MNNEAELLEVVKAARAVVPILIAVRYTAGLGRNQVERADALTRALANLDARNP